jgi:hypothetical protein
MQLKLEAFFGDKKIKNKYIRRVEQHYKADEIIQGTGWANGKGCAVGCILNDYDHESFLVELGLPVKLAYIVDGIFEELDLISAKNFPLEFLSSIKIGADLSEVYTKLLIYILENKTSGLLKGLNESSEIYDILKTCLEFLEKTLTINHSDENYIHINNLFKNKYKLTLKRIDRDILDISHQAITINRSDFEFKTQVLQHLRVYFYYLRCKNKEYFNVDYCPKQEVIAFKNKLLELVGDPK